MKNIFQQVDLIFIFFLSFIFITLPNGIIIGGDWTFPMSNYHFDEFVKISSWSNQNFGTEATSSLIISLFKIVILFFNKIGIQIIYSQKIILFLISLSGFYFFKIFCIYIGGFDKSDIFVKFISLIYILAPVSFNYIQIGWIYSFIAYCLLPGFLFFFLKYLEENKNFYLFLSVLIFSFSIMQIQTLLWYLTPIIIFYFHHRFNNKLSFKKIILFIFLFISLNAYWIFPTVITKLMYESEIFKKIAISSATSGIDAALLPSYLIRNLGSLYNLNFENSISWLLLNKIFYIVVTSAPFLIIFYLIKKLKKIDHFLFIVLFSIFYIFLILMILKEFNGFFNRIEIYSIIRHKGRFIILTSFLTFLLIILLYKKTSKQILYNFKLRILIILLSINLLPWVADFEFKNKHLSTEYSRHLPIRVKNIDIEYENLYKKINLDKDIKRIIYFPFTIALRQNDDPRFYEDYKNFIDQYSALSPKPGNLYYSNAGTEQDVIIKNTFFHNSLEETRLLYKSLLNDVNLYVYRKNIISDYYLTLNEFNEIFNKNNFELYYKSNNIVAYKNNEANQSLLNLSNNSANYINFLFRKNIKLSNNSERTDQSKIEYAEILNNIYKIEINNSTKNYNFLIYNQKYHPGWTLICNDKIKINNILKENNFIKSQIYEYNKQIFDIKNISCDKFYLVFAPELIFYISLTISLLSLIFFLLKSIYEFKNS